MRETPYSRFSTDQRILRDELAIDRTLLANERTLLAYLRAAVALVIAGVSIMHFSPGEGGFWMVGLACIPTGIIAGTIGVTRYRKMQRRIAMVQHQSEACAAKRDTSEPPSIDTPTSAI